MSTGRAGTLLLVVATLVVLATLAAALWIIGSPASQRQVRIDERRVQELAIIEAALDRHWETHQALPASLEEMVASTPGLRLPLADPADGPAYEYRVTGTDAFELCATFATSTAEPPAARSARARPDWLHGEGRHCFQRSAPDADETP